jgi:hypothetical protein
MDFREATDGLFDRVDHETLATRLGVSIAAVRQARLKPEAGAHRSPPKGWEPAVIRVAEERIRHYRRLIEQLRENSGAQNANDVTNRRHNAA